MALLLRRVSTGCCGTSYKTFKEADNGDRKVINSYFASTRSSYMAVVKQMTSAIGQSRTFGNWYVLSLKLHFSGLSSTRSITLTPDILP